MAFGSTVYGPIFGVFLIGGISRHATWRVRHQLAYILLIIDLFRRKTVIIYKPIQSMRLIALRWQFDI